MPFDYVSNTRMHFDHLDKLPSANININYNMIKVEKRSRVDVPSHSVLRWDLPWRLPSWRSSCWSCRRPSGPAESCRPPPRQLPHPGTPGTPERGSAEHHMFTADELLGRVLCALYRRGIPKRSWQLSAVARRLRSLTISGFPFIWRLLKCLHFPTFSK